MVQVRNSIGKTLVGEGTTRKVQQVTEPTLAMTTPTGWDEPTGALGHEIASKCAPAES